MEFEKRKAATLASLGCTETDKSPKGTLDAPIMSLLNTINSHPSYFTTSSCSGRISIFSHPTTTATTTTKKKARGGSWIYISHEPADPDQIISLLFPQSTQLDWTESTRGSPELTRRSDKSSHESPESTRNSDESTRGLAESIHNSGELSQCPGRCELVFRFEPLIIAIECKDLASAQSLVSLAISCGFRESGITSVSNKRVIIAIRCSIRLEVPLGYSNETFVSRDYVRYLADVANEKMEANRKRTDNFLGVLHQNGFRHLKDCDQIEYLPEAAVLESSDGSTMIHDSILSIAELKISSESAEKLFLWGHSACTIDRGSERKILVFGGFGGVGRHARRDDCLLLDPSSGLLEVIAAKGSPSPRMGHTASLVGDYVFVVGGRGDPVTILSDVWSFHVASHEWKFLECTGSHFPPRHRHAAAVLGSKIYVFGGINNDSISSSFFALDTNTLQWELLSGNGERPRARHSHSMVAYKSHIFLFGGYNGEKALGDLYSFDVNTHIWRKENIPGRKPYARFSHSLFVYNNCLGIIGGCPVRQHFQELTLLDLKQRKWNHMRLDSIGKELLVRSTVSVIGDDLVLIGGGAACYAFGTKFSEPVKFNLLPLLRKPDKKVKGEHVSLERNDQPQSQKVGDTQVADKGCDSTSETAASCSNGSFTIPSQWVVEIERKRAKSGKDILKQFGWLDLGRKVYSSNDRNHICFPVTENFSAIFDARWDLSGSNEYKGSDEQHSLKLLSGQHGLTNKTSHLSAMNLLKQLGATKFADETAEVRKIARPPYVVLRESVSSLLKKENLSEELLEELPSRWERLGDIVVLPSTSFQNPVWEIIGGELWPIVAKALNACRLARQGSVAPTGTRDSTLRILFGDNGWVEHNENGIVYSFDATKCMFSWGNLSEKLRMAQLDCKNEVVVDLFAGIGYFTLPFLVRAKARLVYACEWNPHAVEALRYNLQANTVTDRCIVLEGDNRTTAPKGVADRVCLGLLPSSEGSWATAVKALRSEGGILHVHGKVKDSEEGIWTESLSKSIHEIAVSEGYCWEVIVEHIERVKWYAPHVRHLVADVRCRQVCR